MNSPKNVGVVHLGLIFSFCDIGDVVIIGSHMSSYIMDSINLSNVSYERFQFIWRSAFDGSPINSSTSHGRKYLGSILTYICPVVSSLPTVFTPIPSHMIDLLIFAKHLSTNSRTVYV